MLIYDRCRETMDDLVSITMPVHNAAEYLDEAFESVCQQTHRPLEIVIFNDCSTDSSWEKIKEWEPVFIKHGVNPLCINSMHKTAQGTGYARNQAVTNSHGTYICHLDADDIMDITRISKQISLAKLKGNNCLIGSNFLRTPLGSTEYYTEWLNSLDNNDIMHQQYRECTIICPSWFMHRDVYDVVARARGGKGFVEKSNKLKRVPEDLFFFMDHLECGGTLAKVMEPLVTYRYHLKSWSMGVTPIDMQRIRIAYLQQRILNNWSQFSIWGFGRDGKKFFNMLTKENASKVRSFCDIDPKKIGTKYFCNKIRKHIPVINFKNVTKPLIICVASKRCGGELERNIEELQLQEGIDYYHFC
jgi:glycosyltransferase involved in cell wall biosynthesis